MVRNDDGSFVDVTDELGVREFLRFKEHLVAHQPADAFTLEIDLEPFDREFYKLKEPESIGRGVEFLNRRLSSHLFEEMGKKAEHVLEFLSVHRYRNQQLMLNEKITDVPELRDALDVGRDFRTPVHIRLPGAAVHGHLPAYGEEPGVHLGGDTAGMGARARILRP